MYQVAMDQVAMYQVAMQACMLLSYHGYLLHLSAVLKDSLASPFASPVVA
jgi:hypothetical protein